MSRTRLRLAEVAADRRCFRCTHHEDRPDRQGYSVSTCALWDEPTDDDAIAATCCDYTPKERHES